MYFVFLKFSKGFWSIDKQPETNPEDICG